MRTGTGGELAVDIALVCLFIVIAGLFVAAEIALISLRDSQIRQLSARGRRGQAVAELAKNPNRFLAAAQVGVTFSGFLSAALGSERIGSDFVVPLLMRAGWSHSISSTVSLILLTIAIAYISLVLGELVPKRLALAKTEAIALASAGFIDKIATIFRPTIWLLSKSTDAVIKLFGSNAASARSEISEDELVDLVTGHTGLTVEERDIVEEVFNTSELSLHEIMVPRTEVDFLPVNLDLDAATKFAIEHAHSRYPVTRGNSDEVIGFIHVRDLLHEHMASHAGQVKSLLEIIRPVLFLPGTNGVLPALTEMQNKRSHIAVVLDEYGGTDGIVTFEDLVECIIGDIHDEYDQVEEEVTQLADPDEYEVDALISLEDLFEEAGISLPDGPYETAGGFVMYQLGRIPEMHDLIVMPDYEILVASLEGKRADRLLIKKRPAPTPAE